MRETTQGGERGAGESPSGAARPRAPGEALVVLADARLGYGRVAVLERVELEVRRGDFLAIIGPNGAGKTTLLRTVLGVIPPLGGRCELRGRAGYSPQRNALDPIYPFTAAEVVAMGLLGPASAGLEPARRVERVARALDDCGIAELAERAFRELSGGQKQRALVARALVSDPDLLILDEPTNDLDLRGEHEVMELVRALHQGGRTVIMVTHLLHLVARYAERVAFVQDGRLTLGAADELLTPTHLGGLYGVPVVVGEVGGRRAIAPAAAGSSESPPGPSPDPTTGSAERAP